MIELVFILTDFLAVTVGGHASATLPRLPALETVLARGALRRLTHDWRDWLAARSGAAQMTPAQAVAAAWLGAPSATDAHDAGAHEAGVARHYWLATPVHFFAGIDSVQLHPAGLLRLPEAEQQELVRQFAQVFADSPWRLMAFGQRELLLAGPPLSASGLDPAEFTGADPSPGLPRGPDAAALKRLGSEIELWLHEQPLNHERAARGELAVSALWLWGGTRAARPHLRREAGGAGIAGCAAAARCSAATPTPRPCGGCRGAAAEPLPPSLAAAAGLMDARR